MKNTTSTNYKLYNPTTYDITFDVGGSSGTTTIYTQAQPLFIFDEYLKINLNIIQGTNTGNGRIAYIILYEPK